MQELTISLAGIPVGIHPLNAEVQDFFTDYHCTSLPVFEVAASSQDLRREQEILDRKYPPDPSLPPWSPRYLENLAVFRLIADQMPNYDTILFHGSAIAFDGRVYLFSAPSGTGKTTHTQLWLEQLPEAYVLNGDKPFLKKLPGGRILACGSPWRGKEQLGVNENLPLEAICILERSDHNQIQTISPKEAITALVNRVHIPQEPEVMLKAVRLIDYISKHVRLYLLGCNMEPEAAQVSIRAMVRNRPEEDIP